MVDIENTTGEVTMTGSEQAAAVQDQPTESLEAFLSDDAQGAANPAAEPEEAQEEIQQDNRNEKGIKGRLQAENKKGYERGRAEAYAEWEKQKADYEAKIAEYDRLRAEATLMDDAKQLATEEHISVKVAERLLRAERGIPAKTENTNPVVTPAAPVDKATQARAEALYQQAQDVQKQYGIDVGALYMNDETIKAKVNSGEMDFKDVALFAMSNKPGTTNRTPSPVRGGNASSASGDLRFTTMTDEQFEAFNKKIDRGGVYRPPR